MKFAYLGDHAETTLYGVVFPQGVFVSVESQKLQQKLLGNSHFALESAPAEQEIEQPPASDESNEQAPQEQPKRRGRKSKEY